ncbi:MAG: hypothetical protein IJT83_03640 [Victivallales bacterium]|nr:hypothetical protein [Victivallales bacterium]
MDQKLNVAITASEGALVNALNGATQAVNSSTATWAQKLGDTKMQFTDAATSVAYLRFGLSAGGRKCRAP